MGTLLNLYNVVVLINRYPSPPAANSAVRLLSFSISTTGNAVSKFAVKYVTISFKSKNVFANPKLTTGVRTAAGRSIAGNNKSSAPSISVITTSAQLI